MRVRKVLLRIHSAADVVNKDYTRENIEVLPLKSLSLSFQSLLKNIQMLNSMLRESNTLNLLAQLCITCALNDNAVDIVLGHRILSAWMTALRKLVVTDNEACEPAFCCLAQMMLEVEKCEAFVREFIGCGGPDTTVEMLQVLCESKRGSSILAAFRMLLPLCTVTKGQKWLKKNYHKIVECYQLFDSSNEWYASLPNVASRKVQAVWRRFRQTFDSIQETESKRHEAELLAEEERERAKREKKAEKRKSKEVKRVSDTTTKQPDVSPNLQKAKKIQPKAEKSENLQIQDEEFECSQLEPKKLRFEKVLSKKEMKELKTRMKKKEQNLKSESTTEISAKVRKLRPQEEDESLPNVQPNKRKLPATKNSNSPGDKGKSDDRVWKDTDKNKNNSNTSSTSPGKDFPKLSKQNNATAVEEQKADRDTTELNVAKLNIKNKACCGQQHFHISEDVEKTRNMTVGDNKGMTRKVAQDDAQISGKTFSASIKSAFPEQDSKVVADGKHDAVKKSETFEVAENSRKEATNILHTVKHQDTRSNIVSAKPNAQKATLRELEVARNSQEPAVKAVEKTEKSKNMARDTTTAQVYYPKSEDVRATVTIDGTLSHICVEDERDEKHAVPVSIVSSASTEVVIGLVPQSPGKATKSPEFAGVDSGEPCSPLRSGKVYYPKEEIVSSHVKAGDKFEYLFLEQGAEGKKVVPVKVMQTQDGEKKYIALTMMKNEKGEKRYLEPLKKVNDGFCTEFHPSAKCNLLNQRFQDDRNANEGVPQGILHDFSHERQQLLDTTDLFAQLGSGRTNKKRSRATTTGPREIFSVPDDLSPLEEVWEERRAANNATSNLERLMRREYSGIVAQNQLSDNSLQKTDSVGTEDREGNTKDCQPDLRKPWHTIGAFSGHSDTVSRSQSVNCGSQLGTVSGTASSTTQGSFPAGVFDSRILESQMQSENQMFPSHSREELEESKETQRKRNKIEIYRNPGEPCKFGAIGEPCPFPPQGKDSGFPVFVEAKSGEKRYDSSRLRLGDGDCLHHDSPSPNEKFGSRKHWKEPGHFGYGWLDGLSQLISAQKKHAKGDGFEQIVQAFPVFGNGSGYEEFKRQQMEEKWQKQQIPGSGANTNSICSVTETEVQVDQVTAKLLLPQHLLDSPTELKRNRALHVKNDFGHHELSFMQPIQEEFEPENFAPQPEMSVRNASDMLPAQPPQFHQKYPKGQVQTGQGDSHYLQDTFAAATRQLCPGPPQMERVTKEVTKARSVPFLGAPGEKETRNSLPSLCTNIPPEFLSESSGKSSLTSTTVSTNGLKSARDVVPSRSDVSVTSDKFTEWFIIGKG